MSWFWDLKVSEYRNRMLQDEGLQQLTVDILKLGYHLKEMQSDGKRDCYGMIVLLNGQIRFEKEEKIEIKINNAISKGLLDHSFIEGNFRQVGNKYWNVKDKEVEGKSQYINCIFGDIATLADGKGPSKKMNNYMDEEVLEKTIKDVVREVKVLFEKTDYMDEAQKEERLSGLHIFENIVNEVIENEKIYISEKNYETKVEENSFKQEIIPIIKKKIDPSELEKSHSADAENIEKELETLCVKGEDKLALVKVRINQGEFRKRLLKKYDKCCLCNVNNPALLIASHIKPWSQSESEEKLDEDNGFLMCPNHDQLFDKGWISFDDDGKILISDQLDDVNRIYTNVNEGMKIQLTEGNRKYLKYHREIFATKN